jgi:hypothetical protein
MDVFGGPVALGSVMASLLPLAWMLGHRHGLLAASDRRGEAIRGRRSRAESRAAAAPVATADRFEPNWSADQTARLGVRAQLGTGASLEELHADISAYRRAQQILSQTEPAQIVLACSAYDLGDADHARGNDKSLTRPLARAEPRPCRCGTCNALLAYERLDQPSCEAPFFTRV